MVLIAADNRDIERSLQKIVALSQKAGAQFSDDMVVKCADRNLSIEAPPDSIGKVLMRLPWNCLVPLELFRFRVVGDNIVLASYEKGVKQASIACMEAFVELYNLTNKLDAHRRTSPWSLVASCPQLLEHVTRERGYGEQIISRKLSLPSDEIGLLLYSFWRSRVLGYTVDGQNLPESASNLFVLMPVLDAMNHHFSGSPFHHFRNANNSYLVVARSSLVPGTGNESFACYGPHDAFEMWITHGFIDESVPFVCSMPMTIDLPNLGTIRVANFVKNRAPNELPESERDLAFFIPKVLGKRGTDISVTSLLIPGPGAPRALRRTLRFLITEMSPGHPNQIDLVMRAEEQIVTANRIYYEKLVALLRPLSPKEPLQRPILGNFIRICELQLARIQNYLGYRKG